MRLGAPGQQRGSLLVALLGQRLAALLARRGQRRAALALARVRLLHLAIDEGPESGLSMFSKEVGIARMCSRDDAALVCTFHMGPKPGPAGHL